jgi:hypothetical protein
VIVGLLTYVGILGYPGFQKLEMGIMGWFDILIPFRGCTVAGSTFAPVSLRRVDKKSNLPIDKVPQYRSPEFNSTKLKQGDA